MNFDDLYKVVVAAAYVVAALWLLSFIDNDEGSVRDHRNSPNSPNAYVQDR
jgi:hypothetical protein